MAGTEARRRIPTQEHRELTETLELSPRPGVVDALRGTISEPRTTVSHRRGQENQEVRVRLVTEGSGQFGLTDMKDNKEWSGIFNHSVLSARYSVHFAEQLSAAADREDVAIPESHKPNRQTILDGMIVSHAGRRTSDEALWYPEAVEDGENKRSVSNETLGLQLIQEKVPGDALQLVTALAHNPEGFSVDPTVKEGWNYRITSYVDHRTTDHWQPFHERMGDFLVNNFFDKNAVSDEKRKSIQSELKRLIEHKKDVVLGEKSRDITIDEADHFAEILGAKAKSPRLTRKDFMSLVLFDAETEALLQHAGIDTENITDETVPMRQWEKDLRREYVGGAKREIRSRLQKLLLQHLQGNTGAIATLDEEFPQDTWWGKTAREVFVKTTDAAKSDDEV